MQGSPQPKTEEPTAGARVARVHEERVLHLHKLNATQSLTKSLPYEILARIFHHAIRAAEKKRPQFTIGAVCASWRAVVWTTPSLWVTYSQQIWRRSKEHTNLLLQTYLNNSGTLPLSVRLGFWEYYIGLGVGADAYEAPSGPYEEPEILDRMKAALFLPYNAKRIHTLCLKYLPPSWLLNVRQEFANLNELTIAWTPPFILGSFSEQMRVVCNQMQAQPPWTTITILNLERIARDVCSRLLAGCPNLTSFTWTGCSGPLGHLQPNEQVNVMEHLRFMSLEPYLVSEYFEFLFFRFPSLRFFSTFTYDPRGPTEHAFDTFITGVSPTITTLELKISLYGGNYLGAVNLLSKFPRLVQLSLVVSSPKEFPGLFPMLHESPPLPSLQVLKCRYEHRARMEEATVGFLDLMEGKKEAGVDGFRFEFVGIPIYWPEDVQEGLQSLVREGFILEISENGANVPWLSGEPTENVGGKSGPP